MKEFLGVLKNYKISLLVDVRRFPFSKKFPWFRKENISESLKREGINYLWMGEELGGMRREGYENYTNSESYKKGIEKLIDISKKKTLCIMCAEKLFFRCHRRFISKTLKEKGIEVFHIIEINKVYREK